MSKDTYLQGKFIPKHPEKYIGDPTNIIYRSSWEKYAFKLLDESSHVLAWGSEVIKIPYISPKDNKKHFYYPDLLVKIRTKTGKVKWKLIEIKPKKQTRKSRARNPKTRLQENVLFAVNQAKWAAAKQFADSHGIEFCVYTEDSLFKG